MPSLFERRLLVVTGKGGVGKSTLSAALASAAHAQGKRVLVCEVGMTRRLPPLLGAPTGGTDRDAMLEVRPGLFTQAIRPEPAMREYALMKLKFQTIYRAVFENRLVRAFLRMIPSLAETVVLGKVWFEVQAREGSGWRWDLVILDAPATGHGISLLRVPQTLLETLPPGAMRDDAEQMHATLTDPKTTSLQIVTLPEETPVVEAIELFGQVRDDLQIPVGQIFLNSFHEQRFDEAATARFEEALAAAGRKISPAAAIAAVSLHQIRRAERSAQLRQRLEVQLPGVPVHLLPYLALPTWGPEAIELLAREIRPERVREYPEVPTP
ncbi:MAG: ArsA-related P-loop ATPase [Deltaproteobacteria bacterium]|nr:ArsA-related P-loop ATPase [Deltaproteobacteria bacterium]